jgi:restriction system protein
MKKEPKELSPSKQTAAKTVFAAFKILKSAGGQLPGKEVLQKIRETVPLTEWEKEIYQTTGYVRWESILHFYTIDCIKAGFMRKNKRIWYLTAEGEKAIALGPNTLLETASKAYRRWVVENKDNTKEKVVVEEEPEFDEHQPQTQKASLDLLEDQAINGIKDYINRKNPYEFQDLVATLLRAMKYHTPFISQRGRDGGIDIVAFQDPLGATTPRIKVQVKHKPDSKVPPDDLRSLVGLLNKDGDVGLFVTSGTFTNEAERFSRDSHIHIKLIDVDNFISLWQQYYVVMTDEDKNLLPLHSIYFLGTNE